MTRTLGTGRWRLMPGRQSVYYRARMAVGGYSQVSLTDCWYRPRTSLAEGDTSKGIYRQGLYDWFIPKEIVPDLPQLGDQIQTDVSDPATRWTITRVNEALALSVWQCATINLSIAHALRDRVSVYAATNVQDAAGGRRPLFAATATNIPARIQLQDTQTEFRLGKQVLVQSFRVFLAEQVLVTPDDQLRDSAGNVYRVLGYRSPDSLSSLFEIDVELSPP